MAKHKRVEGELDGEGEPTPVFYPVVIIETIRSKATKTQIFTGRMHYNSFILFDMVPHPVDARSSDLVFDIPPLSFDRVHESHIATSSFPIFRMPIELFSHILTHLSTEDLLALSKVDRDCRRLALLSTFKDVVLCFTPDKFNSFLENTPLSTTAPQSPSSYIASCVRRLTVTAEPFNKIVPNYATVLSEYDDLSLAKIDPSFNRFVECASHVVENSYPNIHILDWDAPTLIPVPTLNSILASPIKHLRFKGATVHDDGCTRLNTSTSALETLCFDVSFTRTHNRRRTPLFFKDILFSSTATLRQLIWIGHLNDDEIVIENDDITFPHLRSLTLDIISSNSDQVVQLLLGPSSRVETLAMDTMTASSRKFFATRGYMSPLRRLCWLNHNQGDLSPYDAIMEFLRANTHLAELHIPGPASPEFLELTLLPTLLQEFNGLTSLHLVWQAPDIYDDALEAVSSIPTLWHVWLSAGNQNCLRNTWEVQHPSILARLSPLTHLKTFALSHDTYKVNAHPLAPRSCDYYASRALPVDLDVSKYLSPTDFDIYQGKNVDFSMGTTHKIEMRRLAWESWHGERMQAIADRYSDRFPSLRWLFIGQLVFTRNIGQSLLLASNPPERDPYLTALQKKMSMTLWRPV
ncbi:hypothetical protein BDN70DRAFT_892971 [Pholiota conissans]|uniref:F-box domain-containing protein n=1 Tax=Pholiota conissans TaxID=109636 RepID=A0A9P6D3S6_9AGAR|nr:hypothetical protein BDN70DRAFT_892971 [Pholiota conissans]